LPSLPHQTTNSSAELIDSAVKKIVSGLPRFNSLVIGPGLSKEEIMIKTAVRVLQATNRHLPTVLDADGLHMLSQQPNLLIGRTHTIVTPNAMEFRRLWEAVIPDQPPPPMNVEVDHTKLVEVLQQNNGWGGIIQSQHPLALHTSMVAKKLGVTVCRKGEIDVISDGSVAMFCGFLGGLKRCGGQGDVLAGIMATFNYWASISHEGDSHDQREDKKQDSAPVPSVAESTEAAIGTDVPPPVMAAFCACSLTKSASYKAFTKHYRATVASDLIVEIGPLMQSWFPISLGSFL